MDVQDLRTGDRFAARTTVVGSFGSTPIVVLDVSPVGAKIAHAQPLRLGTSGRIVFRHGETTVTGQGITIWSHLSKRPDASGKHLYESGIRVESDPVEFARSLHPLVKSRVFVPDTGSLERKRARLLEKQRSLHPQQSLQQRVVDVTPDQVLLIQHARERLRSHPDEALKWYNRVKYASRDGAQQLTTANYREDVLAVWEYLERSIDLQKIVAVFEQKSGT